MNVAGGTLDVSIAIRIGKTIIPLQGIRSSYKLLFEAICIVDNNINTSIHPSGILAHRCASRFVLLLDYLNLYTAAMFSPKSTATEVAKALALQIRGKTGETTSKT